VAGPALPPPAVAPRGTEPSRSRPGSAGRSNRGSRASSTSSPSSPLLAGALAGFPLSLLAPPLPRRPLQLPARAQTLPRFLGRALDLHDLLEQLGLGQPRRHGQGGFSGEDHARPACLPVLLQLRAGLPAVLCAAR